MLHVEQFRYDADNFAYLIYGKSQALAIDGGAWQEMLAFLKSNGLSLTIVTNTHGHFDHTGGNEKLLKFTKAEFLAPNELAENKEIPNRRGKSILFIGLPGIRPILSAFTQANILSPATLSSTAPLAIVLPVIWRVFIFPSCA